MTLENIYDDYSNLVYNLALHYVQNIEDAEEITQDVFVTIHQNLSRFEQLSSLKTWIYRITINHSLDHIKKKKAKKRFVFLTSLFTADSKEWRHDIKDFNHPGIIAEQKEAIDRIFCCINLLPDNQKTAVILTKIEGYSQSEAAEIMQISSKAVESLVHRAKSNLKQNLIN